MLRLNLPRLDHNLNVAGGSTAGPAGLPDPRPLRASLSLRLAAGPQDSPHMIMIVTELCHCAHWAKGPEHGPRQARANWHAADLTIENLEKMSHCRGFNVFNEFSRNH